MNVTYTGNANGAVLMTPAAVTHQVCIGDAMFCLLFQCLSGQNSVLEGMCSLAGKHTDTPAYSVFTLAANIQEALCGLLQFTSGLAAACPASHELS
jgi:hypothetical protein